MSPPTTTSSSRDECCYICLDERPPLCRVCACSLRVHRECFRDMQRRQHTHRCPVCLGGYTLPPTGCVRLVTLHARVAAAVLMGALTTPVMAWGCISLANALHVRFFYAMPMVMVHVAVMIAACVRAYQVDGAVFTRTRWFTYDEDALPSLVVSWRRDTLTLIIRRWAPARAAHARPISTAVAVVEPATSLVV